MTHIHERHILADCLHHPDRVDDYRQVFDSFQHPPHKQIAEIIGLLGERTGLVSVTMSVEDRKQVHLCGGDGYIKELFDEYVSDAPEQLIEIVKNKATYEEYKKLGQELYNLPADFDKDVIEKRFFEISQNSITSDYERADEMLDGYMDIIEAKSRGDVSELQSGFAEIDRTLGGLHGGNLILIGGRPAMGKTSFALDIMHFVATKLKEKAGMFSLEMSKNELLSKLVAIQSGLPYNLIRDARFSGTDMANFGRALEQLKEVGKNFLIDDTPGETLYNIRSKARRMVKEGAKVILIDYLQLMTGQQKSEAKVDFIGRNSSGLKQLARETKVPVILLAQLNRANQMGGNREPELHDFRGSGDIEQDADSALFVHRPDPDDYPEVAKILIRKNRHGETRSLDYRFKGAQGVFCEWKAGEKPERENRNNGGKKI